MRALPSALALAAAVASSATAPCARAADPRAADASPSAPRPAAVALRFAWPRPLAAEVQYARTRTQTGRPATSLALRGKLAATPRGDRTLVRYTGWTGANGPEASLLRATEAVTVVVGQDGRAEKVEGKDDVVKAARKLPPFDSDSPQARKALELLPASVEKSALEEWALLVGFWSENDLEIGERYESDSEVAVPAVPGSSVRLRIEVRAIRWLDCPRPERGRCVELELRSRPDRDDVQKVVGALMDKLGVPKEAVQGALGDLVTATEATLVTEPSTLVPHRLAVKRTTDVTGPGGEAVSRVDEQRWSYAYGRAPGKPRR
jgi:hypothetical protein